MTFNNFFEKAKKTVIDVKESQTTANLIDQAQKAAHIAYEQAGKAVDFSREKAGEALDALFHEINGLLPILQACGFIMADLKFAITVPPEFTLIIEYTGRGSTTLNQILSEKRVPLSKLQEMVLFSLLKANEMAVITRRYGYVFGQYELEITLTPKVIIHLISNRGKVELPPAAAGSLPPLT
jgi:hypothetical protein